MIDEKNYESLVIYSNRAPENELTGGAARVISSCNPGLWITPNAEAVNTHKISERKPFIDYKSRSLNGIKVVTFFTDHHLARAHYNTISNGILWPILHSLTPNHSTKTIQKDYSEYKKFIELLNTFVSNMTNKNNLIWIHDYQCVGIKGDIFSFHTPFPSLKEIKNIKINNTSLDKKNFFIDFIKTINQYPLVTFQRSNDLINFSSITNHITGENNQHKLLLRSKLTRLLNIKKQGAKQKENIFEKINPYHLYLSKQISPNERAKQGLLNSSMTNALVLPVGGSPELSPKEAKESEKRLRRHNSPSREGIASIFNHISSESDALFFMSYHRNDYIKRAHIEFAAADQFLKANKNTLGKVFFIFILQPTRSNSADHNRYAKKIKSIAEKLKEKHEDDIHIELNGANHRDIMGLLRLPALAGVSIASKRDGHNLTADEAVLAVSDKPSSMTAVILSDGVGAADTLGGTTQAPGAFVISANLRENKFTQALANTYRQIVAMRRRPEGQAELAERYQVMRKSASYYNAHRYSETALKAAKDLHLPRRNEGITSLPSTSTGRTR